MILYLLLLLYQTLSEWDIAGCVDKLLFSQAALPQGIVPFVFAKEYNVHPEILSTGYSKRFIFIV